MDNPEDLSEKLLSDMDQRENLRWTNNQIQAMLLSEKARHEMTLKVENQFHILRVEELEQLIIKLKDRLLLLPKETNNEH